MRNRTLLDQMRPHLPHQFRNLRSLKIVEIVGKIHLALVLSIPLKMGTKQTLSLSMALGEVVDGPGRNTNALSCFGH